MNVRTSIKEYSMYNNHKVYPRPAERLENKQALVRNLRPAQLGYCPPDLDTNKNRWEQTVTKVFKEHINVLGLLRLFKRN